MDNRKRHFGAIVAGLMLVALGAVWMLHNLDILEFHFKLKQWWPMILLAIGLFHLSNSRRFAEPGAWFMILLGGAFLLTANDILAWRDILKYWPIVLIVIGFSIIFRVYNRHKRWESVGVHDDIEPGLTDQKIIKGTAIFSGLERRITEKDFKGGMISAVFGGVELDLRSAGLSEKGAVLEISAVFGGVELMIPESWVIDLHPSAILGGISNKSENELKSEGRRLVVKASAVFGGIEIKN
jgi:predicted membrane protein